MDDVKDYIREMAAASPRVVVALSGGVDSSLVAAAAHQVLGDRCCAVTFRSELTVARDCRLASETAACIGVEHLVSDLEVLEDHRIARNDASRCYHCKLKVFGRLKEMVGEDGLVMDGTNADDDTARPGLRAAKALGVISPLKAAGMVKSQVRKEARELGLPYWNTPSESCLATRIRTGVGLTRDALAKVETMENFFHEQGVETLRTYHDNLVANVVFMKQYTDIMEKNRDSFAALIKRIGLQSFTYEEWAQ